MKSFWQEYKIGRILLSLGVAICIWAFTINSSNPIRTIAYSGIPVNFTGTETFEDNNLVLLSGGNAAVSLKLKGAYKTFAGFKSRSITVSADLSGFTEPGAYRIPASKLQISLPSNYLQTESVYPDSLEIILDRETDRVFPVAVQLSGTPAKGYRYSKPELSTEKITLHGPETLLDEIGSVVVNVEANNLTESTVFTAPIILLDRDSNVIENELITSDHQLLDITVRTSKDGDIPLRVDLTPSASLTAEDVTVKIDPEAIAVYADEDILSSYSAVTIGQIDLANINLTGKYTFPITLPNKLTAANSSVPKQATVTVSVKNQTEREFTKSTYTLTDLSTAPLLCEVLTDSITVPINGESTFINDLSADEITISADYNSAELGPGEHTINAVISVAAEGHYELKTTSAQINILLHQDEIAYQPPEEVIPE